MTSRRADPFAAAISEFGSAVATRFATGIGEPEDRLRTPLDVLVRQLGTLHAHVDAVLSGEVRLAAERIRPDFAASVDNAVVGYIEVKSPGHGADPNRFRDRHDRQQWERLRCLPNVLYSDGQSFGLYRYGERVGDVVTLVGDVERAGGRLADPGRKVAGLIGDFLTWTPTAPRRARDLALSSARLCRLLREEVRELLATEVGLQALAADWRELLFPQASEDTFADGYAQTVTFALLLARVEGIDFAEGDLRRIATRLGKRHTLIGTALDVLTSSSVLDQLAVAVNTLVRVLSVVDWPTISRGDPDKWLLFYENFLEEYDPALRRRTGSYYTPIGVVDPMVRLVDDLLRERFGRPYGLAAPDVTVVDPGCGTGTYLLRIIDRIAATIGEEEGPGAVPARLEQATSRLVGFEIQSGPFAVAELRLTEEFRRLGSALPAGDLRVYVANTLDNPFVAEHHLAAVYEPIAQSRRRANEVKKGEPVLVVIGNPPYRERSRGQGGWIEAGNPEASQAAPLDAFMPPPGLGLGVYVRHLYNPYVYFWRWATWKVFDHHPGDNRGVVAFITVAGFIHGPGFAGMRSYLRRTADAIWVIDLSPEGHQPEVSTRVFGGVQQPVCITIVARDGSTSAETPAPVHHRAVHGLREEKFDRLASLALDDDGWRECATDWMAPFLPASEATWSQHPALNDVFAYSGTGTMAGRTWVYAPSPEVLRARWRALVAAPADRKPALLREHARDRTVNTRLADGLPGFPARSLPLTQETDTAVTPQRVAFRSFDRQWLIPDKRIINQPNPGLWNVRAAPGQLFLTAPHDRTPTNGPAATFTALVPDVHHYHGRGGRAIPMWLDASGTTPNVVPGLLAHLAATYGEDVGMGDLFAYVAAVVSHPGYTARFAEDLAMPGVRVPWTADPVLFKEAVAVGRRVVWLHTYGERYIDPAAARPPEAPRLAAGQRPLVARLIPSDPGGMPETVDYDATGKTLTVGAGAVLPVDPSVWEYEVSGVRVLRKWFGYRLRDRRDDEDREPDDRHSALDHMTSQTWPPEWTTELLELLNVLGLLVELEPAQALLLEQVVAGPLVTVGSLCEAGVLPVARTGRPAPKVPRSSQSRRTASLLDAQ